ncbi:response regulator [Zhihengliuella flava]|uniref:DNA-binding NarL/FixJ family response regulator n=1 Tax=Zhihengliuella flava TaxID=1285193 RepID=A0A931DAL0_9MICC|nr:response regulator transcription factor [Zhihengliuella flava]MBG6085507.1 DNA-binding NarL/FixJ family response regulator [Zhihengliuella flava]
MIRLLVADDHPVVRTGLRAMLAEEPGLEIVGEASTPSDAFVLAAQLTPDVVLMDLQFGVADTGADATHRIRGLPTPPAVLVLTNYDTDGDILGAVEAGASGYLLKDSPPAELIAAIRAAAAGETALAPAIAGRLIARLRDGRPELTRREHEVLALVADGAANHQLAARLHISEATVKSHLVHIFTKLGVSSRTAAVAVARAQGMIR